MSSEKQKVFGLGLNKTGTTTLDTALTTLGYRVKGPDQKLARQIQRGDYAAAFECIERHDAVQDLPWPLMYKQIFEKYGTSAKYVLTRRTTAEVWLRSLKSHRMQNRVLKRRTGLYGAIYPFGYEKEFLDYYNAHNEGVRQFFREMNAEHVLLEVCWEEGHGWSELCEHLGVPALDGPIPHSNATATRHWRLSRQYANAVFAHVTAFLGQRQIQDRLFATPFRVQKS